MAEFDWSTVYKWPPFAKSGSIIGKLQAMQKLKMSNNEASKGYTSMYKSRLLGTDDIISEIFHLWDQNLFGGHKCK